MQADVRTSGQVAANSREASQAALERRPGDVVARKVGGDRERRRIEEVRLVRARRVKQPAVACGIFLVDCEPCRRAVDVDVGWDQHQVELSGAGVVCLDVAVVESLRA